MKTDEKQATVNTLSIFLDSLPEWANQFYKAKKQERVSQFTQAFYKQQLGHFLAFCEAQVITHISQITADNIRDYLLWLEEEGHNPGGRHAAYRVLKTFLIWYDNEAEPEGWRNPVKKVKAPKLEEEPLDPVEIADVRMMVATCDSSFRGKRNRALFLFLLDTGLRARELLSLDLDQVDLMDGTVTVIRGKGGKGRNVVIGSETRKAVRAYLRARKDRLSAFWVDVDQAERLGYGGLRLAIIRHAELAGITPPAPHDFRRAFAINMLRKGVDLATLARLMGHTTLKVLFRYLKHIPDDLREAHAKGSPVDHGDL